MKRSKLLKISIPLVIAIFFLSWTSTVYAVSNNLKWSFRPLSDWEANNPSIFYTWSNPSYGIWLADWLNGIPPPPGTYGGYIKERQLPDGRAEVTVYLTLHNTPLYGLWDLNKYSPFMGNEYSMFEEGSTIFLYLEVNKFIIPYPGAPIPSLFEIAYPEDWISTFGCGWGSGIFSEYAEGFPQGELGTIFIFQYGYVTEEGEFVWPHEIINIYG
ncbi:MAG: hypothetical protein ACFE8C_06905 [Promethearchaeota archaeon]